VSRDGVVNPLPFEIVDVPRRLVGLLVLVQLGIGVRQFLPKQELRGDIFDLASGGEMILEPFEIAEIVGSGNR